MKERIICAGIYYDDGKVHAHQPKSIETGYVMQGRRHHEIICLYFALTGKQTGVEPQGFITSENRFLSRREALKIAIMADQVLDLSAVRGGKLYSEDLY